MVRGTVLSKGLTYRDAGVDIDAGEELVRRIGPAAATRRPEQLGGLGGFAALATLPDKYREPVLVTGTDGVGTKLKLAIDHDRTTTSARTWWPCASTTCWSPAPSRSCSSTTTPPARSTSTWPSA
jgi:hypothetical protein